MLESRVLLDYEECYGAIIGLCECDEALWEFCEANFNQRGRAEIDALPWVGPFAPSLK